MQVNGVQLYGKSRREAITFLKEVPPPFTMVCCRRLFDDGSESLLDEPIVEVSPPEQKVDFSRHSVRYKDNNFCLGKVRVSERQSFLLLFDPDFSAVLTFLKIYL